jgi:hypothetical protein
MKRLVDSCREINNRLYRQCSGDGRSKHGEKRPRLRTEAVPANSIVLQNHSPHSLVAGSTVWPSTGARRSTSRQHLELGRSARTAREHPLPPLW